MERMCRNCPAFFEVKQEGLVPTGGGWQNVTVDGKDVILCRPGTTVQKKKTMERFCYYCLATTKAKNTWLRKLSMSGSGMQSTSKSRPAMVSPANEPTPLQRL